MDFGDGNTETSATVTHSYDSSDNYTVTLEVTDSEDRRDTDSLDIEVNSSTTVEIVNDFESQDGQAVNPNWGSEVIADDRNTQIDGYITTNTIEGAASRNLGGDGGGTVYKHVRNSPAQFSGFSGKLRLIQDDNENSDEVRFSLRDESTRVIGFVLKADGQIRVNQDQKATWSSTPTDDYLFEAYNINWTEKKFDWEITNTDTGNSVASDTRESFWHSASSADSYYFGGDNGGVSGTVEGAYDSLEVVR